MMKQLGCLVKTMQILLLAAVVGLEFLSGKRGGLNHHVLARKVQWSQSLLSAENLHRLDVLLGITVLVLIGVLLRGRHRPSGNAAAEAGKSADIVLAICFSALTFFSYHLPFFLQLRASSYATLTLAAVSLLQLGVVFSLRVTRSIKT